MKQAPIQTPLERVLDLFPDAKGPNAQGFYQTHCPAHNDGQRSLSFKEIGDGVYLDCFAFCPRSAILASLNLEEKDLHLSGKHFPKSANITLLDLAIDKRIHWQFLMTLGLLDIDHKGVKIPYYMLDGKPYERYKMRTHLIAKQGSSWDKEGSNAPVIPYGLQRMAEAQQARQVIIVEGESDCWTLWIHKFHALGIPGAKNVGCLQIEHITSIDEIYIMQEPDQAGQNFPIDLKKQLDKLGYKGRVYAIDLQEEHQVKDPNELHKKDAKGFRAAFESAMLHAKPLHKVRPKPTIHRLRDLQERILPATKWAIPDILPEGLTLLVGKPKLGKSWLLLALLQAIASGSVALGSIPVEQGQALYISLEDNEKRLQKRINTILGGKGKAAIDFLYTTKWARLNEGGKEDLEHVLIDNPLLRLIGIDTYAKIKPRATRGMQKQQYDEDYDALTPLQELASKYGVAIIVVHHFRKMGSEDMIDQISGSAGMAGVVDNFLLLERKRGETDAHLHAFGRDIEHDQNLIMEFDHNLATWKIKGDADDATLASTPVRQAILNVLAQHKEGLTFKELTSALGSNSERTTRNNVQPLRDDGKVLLKDSRVRLVTTSNADTTSNAGTTSNTAELEQTVTSDYYSVTSPSLHIDNPLETPIESLHNGYTSQVTSLTSVSIETKKKHDPLASWLIPGTYEWNKQVERNGEPEMHQRRDAALRER